jgi:Tfp pilus assembly protein PilF
MYDRKNVVTGWGNCQYYELMGKLDEAVQSYRQAIQITPTDPHPLLSLGSVQMKKEDYLGARASYEHALAGADL